VAERGDFPGDYDDFVVVNSGDGPEPSRPHRDRRGSSEVDPMMRDVVYEVSEDGPARPTTPRPERSSTPKPEPSSSTQAEADVEPEPADEPEEPEDLPTLEEANQQLISRALKQFDGNRRKTAQALGISERTLYRKLKDIDEDL
jgi:DNA-binding NtrC family response regulator